MTVKLQNNAYSTLRTAILSTDTTVVVASGEGANFPALGVGEYFYATIEDAGGNSEIVKVTARSTDTLTVTRAAEATTALDFAADARIEMRVTAQSVLDAASDALDGLATVASTGAYSDLTGTPTLATVATSGAYADLTGAPSLGTASTFNDDRYLHAANNLSDLADAATARTQLGLGTMATAATGDYVLSSAVGALAAGDTAADVPFSPTGNVASTDVQAAIAEVDSETDARLTALEALAGQTAVFKEVQTAGTEGGGFTSGDWRTRTLNTTEGTITGASLATNQITLPAGTYEVMVFAPAYQVGEHQARLYNITDAAEIAPGAGTYSNEASDANAQSVSHIVTVFTLAASKTIEVQHRCEVTRATDGFGRAINLGASEVYTQVRVRKIA